jgi:Triose-phosphate Transporter family
MNDSNLLHHHPDVVYSDKHRPRGWRASSDSMPHILHSPRWLSDWEDSFPLIGVVMNFIVGAKSAIRRKASLWDHHIFFDRSRLTRSTTPLPRRTSSLSAMPSASTLQFILLCCLWYTSSAMSSNTGKSIMNQFQYPVTLTFIQFAFVAFYCALFMSPAIRFSKMRKPTPAIFKAAIPMGAFQVGGHIFSSMAISRIPVSTVHTIKVRGNQISC